MKEIRLSQGRFALIDDADFEHLNQWKWAVMKSRNKMYAFRSCSIKNGHPKQTILMHREIMKPEQGMCCDHINHDGLDNRRENLRICTNAQNVRYQRPKRGNASGYIGVKWDARIKKWCGRVTDHGRDIYCGAYDSPIKAALARDIVAYQLHGTFTTLNFSTAIANPPRTR